MSKNTTKCFALRTLKGIPMNNKKTLLALAVFALSCAFTVNAAKHLEHDTKLGIMQKLVDDYRLPSLSVAIGIDNKIVFADAIGFKNVTTKELATAETQYSVGSIAKPMTGLVLAKLVDNNKVVLENPVSYYLKDLPYSEPFTVKQLAAHTAGIAHNTPERETREFVDVRDHKSPFEAIDVFDKHGLLFKPGADFKYSSNGYILLSALIEKVSEKNYVDYMNNALWSKFNMHSTELDDSTAGQKHEATYYKAVDEQGNFIPATTKRDRSFLFGGGGFISTPSDLVRMAQSLYNENYLSTATQKNIFTPVKLNDGKINPQRYSLGWRIGKIKAPNSKENNEKEEKIWMTLHHGGVTDKASTAYLFVVPECKASIAFATNTLPNKFWQIRPEMAALLKKHIDFSKCGAAI